MWNGINTSSVITIKSAYSKRCTGEHAKKDRGLFDDAYFDSYDGCVFSVDASPALSPFPGKSSLGRDIVTNKHQLKHSSFAPPLVLSYWLLRTQLRYYDY